MAFIVNKPLEEGSIHRAKTWEIAFYALNNTSTNIYMMMMMYVSYYVSGFMGIAAVLVGVLLTVMRVWDGVTDPIVGFIVDRTNGKFGKNRPFIVIGNVIMFITTYILFHFGHQLPDNYGLRLAFFLGIYAIYILGYTAQCVVTKSAQTCMTNDPEQRPTFAIFDSIYNTLLFGIGSGIFFTNYLIPKYASVGADGAPVSGLRNAAMYHELWWVLALISAVFATLGIIGLWRKDRPKYFGTGDNAKIGLKDYWDVLRHNRAIQMLVVSASTDKLFTGIQGNAIVMTSLFGIIMGFLGIQGQVAAMATIPTVVISILGLRFIASKMGQKKALLFGTWGGIITSVLMFILLYFGNPSSAHGVGADGKKYLVWSGFLITYLVLYVLQRGMVSISGNIVIPMTADCADYETYRSGRYMPGLMGTLFSFVDKIVSSLTTTFVSLMYAVVGFAVVQPTENTPLSDGLLWVTLIAYCGMPIIGFLFNVVAMKFYPLTKEKMIEVQAGIADIKAKHAANMADTAVASEMANEQSKLP